MVTSMVVLILLLLEKWLGKMALKRWQEEEGLRQAKLLIEEQPSEAWLVELRKFD